MKRFVARFQRGINAVVILSLLLGLLPPSVPAQGVRGAIDRPSAVPADAIPAPARASGSTSRLVQLTATATSTATPVLTVTPTVLPTTTPEPTATPPSLLAFTKRAEPEEVSPGDLITYTLVLTNSGGTLLEGLVVSDTMPAGLAHLPYSADGGAYDPQTRRLTWQVATLAPGATLSLGFQARVRGDAADPMANTAQVTGGGLAVPLTARATTRVARARSQAAITPEQGGELVSPDGRVRVTFPPGAVRAQATARYVERGRQANDGRIQRPVLRFDLDLAGSEPRDPQGHVRLARPVTITLHVDDLVDLSRLPGQKRHATLAYQAEPERDTWLQVPLEIVDRETGLVQAQLNKLSSWIFQTEDDYPQKGENFLLVSQASADAFTGYASLSYPLAVPPGPGGLRPDLRLAYSSGAVDGVLGNVQSSWVGLGWSLSGVEIVRTLRNGGNSYIYEDRYALLMHGRTQRLVRDPDVPGLYRAESEGFVRVQRFNDQLGSGSLDNASGEWWLVTDRDGTQYRLGYRWDSEQMVHVYGYDPVAPPWGYAGEATDQVAYRWRVDTITNTHGLTMTYGYVEENPVGWDSRTEAASYLDEVRYAGGPGLAAAYTVKFVREARDFEDNATTCPHGCFQGYELIDRQRLKEVQVWLDYDGPDPRLIRKVEMTYQRSSVVGIVSSNPWDQGALCGSKTYRENTLLQHLQVTGRDGMSSLPPVEFGYLCYQNRDYSGNPQDDVFWYARLVTVTNGYGGQAEYDYAHDGRPWWEWYSYRVAETRRYDGLGGVVRTAYAYPDGSPYYSDQGPDLGAMRGYTRTVETVLHEDGGVARQIKRWYEPADDFLKGQPITVTVGDVGAQALRTTTYSYGVTTTVAPQGDQDNRFAAFVAPAVVTETMGTRQSATAYGYDDFGNVITETLYGDVSTVEDDRLVARAFYHNTDRWIVDRPAWERVFAGRDRTADGTEAAMTAWGYDGDFDPAQVPITSTHPITGELTTVAVYHTITTTLTIPISDGTITTTVANPAASYTTAYEYDAYGNRTVVTDARGNRTMMAYEEVYHTYPLTVTNALGQAVRTDYDPALGRVITATDANGAVTAYEYDPFGRLTKVIRPGDSVTLPTLSYLYDDFYPGPSTKVQTLYREKSGCEPCVRPILRFYDGLGRVVQTKAESQDASQMIVGDVTYDARGLVAEESVPYFVDGSASFWDYVTPDTTKPKTSYTYDALGRVTGVTNPDGTMVQIAYDGWQRTVVDEKDQQRIYEADAFGRLVTVEEYTGTGPYTLYATTSYGYDSLGDLAVVTDTHGVTTTMAYDPLGRKVSMRDPDMGEWTYDYDAVGNLIWQQDANRQAIEFSYDDLNRLKSKTLTTPDTRTLATYGYDGGPNGVGRRTWMDSGGATTAWDYDARGRVITETQRIGLLGTYTTTYGYDTADRLGR